MLKYHSSCILIIIQMDKLLLGFNISVLINHSILIIMNTYIFEIILIDFLNSYYSFKYILCGYGITPYSFKSPAKKSFLKML